MGDVVQVIRNTHDKSLASLCKRAQHIRETALHFEEEIVENPYEAHKFRAVAIHLYQQAVEIYMLAINHKSQNEEERCSLKEWLANCLDRLLELNTSGKK